MAEWCPLSCGVCAEGGDGGGGGGGGGCEDALSNCADYAGLGQCEYYFAECVRTCV